MCRVLVPRLLQFSPCLHAPVFVQVNADAVVAIEAEMTLTADSGGEAEWTLTEGVLNGYDDLSLAASSSIIYTVRVGRYTRPVQTGTVRHLQPIQTPNEAALNAALQAEKFDNQIWGGVTFHYAAFFVRCGCFQHLCVLSRVLYKASTP